MSAAAGRKRRVRWVGIVALGVALLFACGPSAAQVEPATTPAAVAAAAWPPVA